MRPPTLLVLIALLIFPPASLASDSFDDALDRARAYTELFYGGDMEALWQSMTDEMQEALETEEALSQLRSQVEADFGDEAEILSEQIVSQDGFRIYMRMARHEDEDVPLVTQWTLDADEQIAGFFVRPAPEPAPSAHVEYETRAELRLPFDGEWHVFWGGRTIEENYHAMDPGQRFASDFLVMRGGTSHSGDGEKLTDYYCWDEPILAPAQSLVVSAVDGLPDMEIGETDAENIAGNHVVLDLGNDEFAFLAHLRKGSVTVEEGDAVVAGQEIGRCGNSGNTSEPHLHFHLQNAPVLGEGEGLPAFFIDYEADGEPVERGEPRRGQSVAPADL